MQIVPVIDLMGGQVVHARRGERERYQPLRSTLCQGAEPLIVVAGLLELFPFRSLYVADLDAIRGAGDHRDVIESVRAAYPDLELWLDAAVADYSSFAGVRARGCVPVVGSESLRTIEWLAQVPPEAAILSLDHREGSRLGPAELWQRPQLWPQRVLAMNLSRVGANEGPDLALMQMLQRTLPDAHIYAAGGVRHLEDLDALHHIGARGALVATALHSGAISRAALHSGAISQTALHNGANPSSA